MREQHFIINMNYLASSASKRAISCVKSVWLRTVSTEMEGGPIENAIRAGLAKELSPVHVEVVNESYMHNVPKGSETHFKVLVVSQQFEGMPLIKRHRLVNDIVKTQLEGDFVHALSIVAKTPPQWDPNYSLEPSPNCKGGFGK